MVFERKKPTTVDAGTITGITLKADGSAYSITVNWGRGGALDQTTETLTTTAYNRLRPQVGDYYVLEGIYRNIVPRAVFEEKYRPLHVEPAKRDDFDRLAALEARIAALENPFKYVPSTGGGTTLIRFNRIL